MLKIKTTVGILGYGEVGKALAKFYKNPQIKDLIRKDKLIDLDILHICIPYDKNFVKTVVKEIKSSKAKLVIINSTVAPGTTRKIQKLSLHNNIVHSSVRGKHPNLYLGLKTYVKFVGSDNLKAGKMAVSHFRSLGIKSKLLKNSVASELAKLFCTTYYGVCVAWFKEMARISEQFGLDYQEVFPAYNKTYNSGIRRVGMKQFVRPELQADKGPIGGHCVVPNAQILAKYIKSPALDLILKYAPSQN